MIGLLLGDELGSTGVAVARLLGVGLISAGIAAWESPGKGVQLTTRAGLCIYNVGTTVVFAIYGSLSLSSGILLWPAIVLYGLIGVMLLRALTSNN